MNKNKIGIILVALGGIIVLILLGVILFVPTETASQTFRGPTAAPHVGGPTDLPPK